jgi:hypothetical protein
MRAGRGANWVAAGEDRFVNGLIKPRASVAPAEPSLGAKIEALRAECIAYVDAHVAEVAQRDGLGIPIGAVRQLIVRGRNPFEAVEALLRERNGR